MYLGRIVESASHATLWRDPRRPYTKALFAAVPSTDPTHKRTAATIRASSPPPIIASGCPIRVTLSGGDRPLPGRGAAVAARRRRTSCRLPFLPESTPARQRSDLGGDIGGTFTDIVLETPGGELPRRRCSPPRRRPGTACSTACSGAFRPGQHLSWPGRPDRHGTTLATNAIIERKGARRRWSPPRAFAIRSRWRRRTGSSSTTSSSRSPSRWCRAPSLHRAGARVDAKGGVRLALDESAAGAGPHTGRQGRRKRRGGLPAQLRQPGARAPRRLNSRRKVAQRAHLAVVRRLPGGTRVRAILDDLRERLRATADGALSRKPASAHCTAGFACRSC